MATTPPPPNPSVDQGLLQLIQNGAVPQAQSNLFSAFTDPNRQISFPFATDTGDQQKNYANAYDNARMWAAIAGAGQGLMQAAMPTQYKMPPHYSTFMGMQGAMQGLGGVATNSVNQMLMSSEIQKRALDAEKARVDTLKQISDLNAIRKFQGLPAINDASVMNIHGFGAPAFVPPAQPTQPTIEEMLRDPQTATNAVFEKLGMPESGMKSAPARGPLPGVVGTFEPGTQAIRPGQEFALNGLAADKGEVLRLNDLGGVVTSGRNNPVGFVPGSDFGKQMVDMGRNTNDMGVAGFDGRLYRKGSNDYFTAIAQNTVPSNDVNELELAQRRLIGSDTLKPVAESLQHRIDYLREAKKNLTDPDTGLPLPSKFESTNAQTVASNPDTPLYQGRDATGRPVFAPAPGVVGAKQALAQGGAVGSALGGLGYGPGNSVPRVTTASGFGMTPPPFAANAGVVPGAPTMAPQAPPPPPQLRGAPPVGMPPAAADGAPNFAGSLPPPPLSGAPVSPASMPPTMVAPNNVRTDENGNRWNQQTGEYVPQPLPIPPAADTQVQQAKTAELIRQRILAPPNVKTYVQKDDPFAQPFSVDVAHYQPPQGPFVEADDKNLSPDMLAERKRISDIVSSGPGELQDAASRLNAVRSLSAVVHDMPSGGLAGEMTLDARQKLTDFLSPGARDALTKQQISEKINSMIAGAVKSETIGAGVINRQEFHAFSSLASDLGDTPEANRARVAMLTDLSDKVYKNLKGLYSAVVEYHVKPSEFTSDLVSRGGMLLSDADRMRYNNIAATTPSAMQFPKGLAPDQQRAWRDAVIRDMSPDQVKAFNDAAKMLPEGH